VDDCTFFYVNQYYATTSDADWLTRFGSFRIEGCRDTDTSSEPQTGLATERKQWREQQRQRRRQWWAWVTGEQ
jgi:hypothetical protein